MSATLPHYFNARPLRSPRVTLRHSLCRNSNRYADLSCSNAMATLRKSGVAYRRIICPLRSLKLAPSAPQGAHVSIPLVCAAGISPGIIPRIMLAKARKEVHPQCVRSHQHTHTMCAVIARPTTPSAETAQRTPLALRVEGESGVA